MPPDVVTVVISTGIGVSVIAGVLSGVCYILAHGYTGKRSRKPSLQWHCAVCGTYLRAYTGKDIKVVICVECEERVCKKRCSKRDSTRHGWTCYTCLKRPSWIHNIFDSIRSSYKKITFKNSTISQHSEQMGEKWESSDPKRNKERECVRDFIEKIVSTIVGGSVDDASIFRIYNDKQYASTSEQSPSSAHSNLKLLIEKILQETARLPHFRRAVDNSAISTEKERTYEDLLATAILNKIISKHEDELPSSSEASVADGKFNKEYFFGDGKWETKWKHTEEETSSLSSIDEYLQSDSSLGSTKYVDRVSLTIQQRIEEVPPSTEHDEIDNDFQYYRSKNSSLNEQSNWFLQKRPFPGTVSPVPVPMLVPNPVTAAKVLIGDKEIDDTSDLSDASSDESDDENLAHETRNLTIDSTVIIGENSNHYFSDEETSFDSGVRDDRDDFSDREKSFHAEHKPGSNVDDENVEDVSIISSHHSNVEKDSEYLEKYGSLPKTIFKSPSPAFHSLPSLTRQSEEPKQEILEEYHEQKIITHKTDNATPVFEGSYSKKEKEKWNHPVNMQYNPYSEENIRKRIRTSEAFGRDYYTKLASAPSGRAKSDETENFWTLDDDANEDNNILYRAVPAKASDSDFEIDENSIKTTGKWSLIDDNSELTSNSDLSLVNYYDVENSKIYHQSSENEQDKVEITINKKEALFPESDDLIGFYVNTDVTEPPTIIKKVNEKEVFYSEPEELPIRPVPRERNFTENVPKITKRVNTKEVFPPEPNDIEVIRNRSVRDYVATPRKVPDNIKSPTFEETTEDVEPPPLPKTPIPATRQNINKPFNEIPTKENQNTNNGSVSPQIVLPKKSDNTLIKKIYSNPVVRSFALSNREAIPYESAEELKKDQPTKVVEEPPKIIYHEPVFKPDTKDITPDPVKLLENKIKNREFVIPPLVKTEPDDNNFSLEFSDSSSVKTHRSEYDEDFKELKQKRLVANRLDGFSKSFPNLTRSNSRIDRQYTKPVTPVKKREGPRGNFVESRRSFEHSEEEQAPISVKNLKKLFEKSDRSSYTKDKPVHSLTARSISKQLKQQLWSSQSSDEVYTSRSDDEVLS